MVIIVYLAIIFTTATQSASAKAFTRQNGSSLVFNVIKGLTAVALFAIMAAIEGFSLHLPTVLYGLGYGASLCLSMHTGFRALCLGPMALTSMLVSFSILIPTLWGVTVGGEDMTLFCFFGILLLLGAILLTNGDKIWGKGRAAKAPGGEWRYGPWLLLVAATFLSNGIGSVLQKQYQTVYPDGKSSLFMFYAMLLCALVYFIISLVKLTPTDLRAAKKPWLGAVSGIANGLASFFTLVLAGMENASVLFPAISAGTLMGAILCGRFLFKEKLKLNHYFALLAGLLAVIFMKL